MLVQIKKTAEFLKEKTNFNPEIGIILGSGLGSFVDEVDIKFSIPYDEISEFVFNEDSEYEFILKNGKTRIMLGTNKLSTKMKYLNSFVQAFDGEKEITDYKYIDLRFKTQVIVKVS